MVLNLGPLPPKLTNRQIGKIRRKYLERRNLIGGIRANRTVLPVCLRPKVLRKNFPEMAQGKNWCFTLNNPTPEEVVGVQGVVCRYLLYGEEVGEAGTPHLQGFVVFNGNKRLNAVKTSSPVLTGSWREVQRSRTSRTVARMARLGQVVILL